MASRTKQKEEARVRRLAEEQARAEHARRDRRLRMVGGVVLIAVAVVAIAIAISSGGSSTAAGLASGSRGKALSQQVQQLLAGIPQSGARLGDPNAKVTLVYYGDLQCPICQQFTVQGGFPQLVANDVRSGKVQIVYRAFETATRDPSTFQTQQVAALAAGKQSHFWDFIELFYRQQGAEGTGYVTDAYLTGLAQEIPGLNLTRWRTDRSGSSLVSQVQSDGQSGTAAGVQGTPTLIFKGPKGKVSPNSGVPSYGDLQQAIKQVS
ncbi:MAG: DsbA family protein [Solirubrobacteraceae bacterium]